MSTSCPSEWFVRGFRAVGRQVVLAGIRNPAKASVEPGKRGRAKNARKTWSVRIAIHSRPGKKLNNSRLGTKSSLTPWHNFEMCDPFVRHNNLANFHTVV